jgi:hypothetical protein
MAKHRIIVAATLAVVTVCVGAGVELGVSGSATAAGIDPAQFVSGVDNPYYPLPSGSTLIYRGVRDGSSQVDRVHVTDRTKLVQGVETVVVLDIAKHQGRVIEKTYDFFAQDVDGNVWYFGENTKEYDAQGNVTSTEGSWEAGVDGGVAGIIMEAAPQVADGYRQEYYAGHAEDQAWILSLDNTISVPYGRLHKVIRTMEWSPLEPNVVDEKYYAPGIGIALEISVAGGQEVAKLVAVHTA